MFISECNLKRVYVDNSNICEKLHLFNSFLLAYLIDFIRIFIRIFYDFYSHIILDSNYNLQ